MSGVVTLDPKTHKNELVVMSNHLIRSTYRYSLPELRFILTIISMIKKEDTEFVTYQLSAKDFSELIETKHKDEYSRIKKLGMDLQAKPIIFENKHENEFTIQSWFKKFSYKNGVIQCSFHDDLKPYLLQLQEKFTRDSLGNFLLMKSRYAMMMFLLLKSWENHGHFEISIDDLREMFDLNTKAYERYHNLKAKVIDVAVSEINKSGTMKIDYRVTQKEGKKITHIRFDITSDRKNNEIPYEADDKSKYSADAIEVVDLFVKLRKQHQPAFNIQLSSGKADPYDVMDRHLKSGLRTKEQYIDMINWLFTSKSKDASWRRRIIHNMNELILNFDKCESAAIEVAEDELDAELRKKLNTRISTMRKNNVSEDEIEEEIKRMVEAHSKKRTQAQFTF